jgi:SAM-dependent methyltransferase
VNAGRCSAAEEGDLASDPLHVHEVARDGFGRSADAYEHGRPGYAPQAIAWLRDRLGLRTGVTVVDLAAGTGKLSHALAATGATVIAVEPLAAMRDRIRGADRVLAGTAESIPLPAGSAQAVTVGQAFHWFDGDLALRQIHDVLMARGALALVWNRRRLEDAVQAEVEEILAPHRGSSPTHRSEHWRAAFERTTLFGPLEEKAFPHGQELDAAGLAAHVGSISFIATLPEHQRTDVLARASALAGSGRVVLRYSCDVHIAERSGDATSSG